VAAQYNPLLTATERLERTLGEGAPGRERDWAREVDDALAGLEQAVRQRAATLIGRDGSVVKVDRPRLPSPTVDRQAAHLRQELDDILGQLGALRLEVQGASQAFGGTLPPTPTTGALPAAPRAGAVPDFGGFRQKAQGLVEAVRRYEEEAAHMVLESVNTDIGAGD
jgi:hypothetical protein